MQKLNRDIQAINLPLLETLNLSKLTLPIGSSYLKMELIAQCLGHRLFNRALGFK